MARNNGDHYRSLAAEWQQRADQASYEAAMYKANGNDAKARSAANAAHMYAQEASRQNSQALREDLEVMRRYEREQEYKRQQKERELENRRRHEANKVSVLDYLPVEVQLRCFGLICWSTLCFYFFAFYMEADTVKEACITLAISIVFLLLVVKECIKIFLYYRT